MDQRSQVVDQLAQLLAARRREKIIRDAGYVALARAVLADEPETAEADQATFAA